MSGTDRPSVNGGATVLPRGVRRALDAMHAAPEREISLAELAAIAELSPRALQRQFRAFVGKTPQDALRDIRFDCARRELLRGTPGIKIMDVALRCGFPHFGRFAVEYRRRYGETPSQTLKRQALFFHTISSRFQLRPHGGERPQLTVGAIESLPSDGDFAHGIADELTTALTRGGVSVVGASSASRYQLAGALRQTGAQTRLVFRLIDRETGRHLWAHRIEAPFTSAFAVDEPLAARIVAALQPSLRTAEIDRALNKRDCDLTAQDLALRAMPRVVSLDAEGNARGIDLLDAALARDPDNALATALASWAHAQRVVYHFTSALLEDRARGEELARHALALRPDPTALAIVGGALSLLRNDTAEQTVAKALAIDGGSAWAWSRSAWIDVYRDNDEAAIERFMIALELAPDDSLAFNNMYGIGIAHFNAGRFHDSALWQERALAEHPTSAWIHRTLCAAYVFDGAKAEAQRALGLFREAYPDLTVAKLAKELPPLPQASCERVVEALQDAGLPA